ncbi:Putative membrane protein [Richelia intracellularis HH01]|uniref:Putative membrane protein n=1 Tax=Richelia intracellularis HH01 TaxID=1165094 RepID=M1X1N8_9NOST|nr:Putative membrane protein [Richelia intracellularis HH01]
MPRSLLIFKRQGMNVIPAPTDFLVSEEKIRGLGITPKAAILSLIPDVNNLHELTLALKEYLGILIYYLQGWL